MNFLYKNDLPNDLDLGSVIAIDTETTGLNINRDRLCLIQISSGDGNCHLVQFEPPSSRYRNDSPPLNRGSVGSSLLTIEAPNLKKLLSDNKILKLFHFARFDLVILQRNLGIEINNIYCTKIASKLIRTYTDSHGLKALCEELLGVEISKKQQSSDWANETISEEQIKYAASDVLYLHQLKEKLDVMLIRENRLNLARECFAFLQTRARLDLAGFENDIFNH